MTATLEVVILGSGSSGGVPRADGAWGACDPANPLNRRSRCSLMVRRPSAEGPERQTTVVVDASPEFRLQANAAGTFLAAMSLLFIIWGLASVVLGRMVWLRSWERALIWPVLLFVAAMFVRWAIVLALHFGSE